MDPRLGLKPPVHEREFGELWMVMELLGVSREKPKHFRHIIRWWCNRQEPRVFWVLPLFPCWNNSFKIYAHRHLKTIDVPTENTERESTTNCRTGGSPTLTSPDGSWIAPIRPKSTPYRSNKMHFSGLWSYQIISYHIHILSYHIISISYPIISISFDIHFHIHIYIVS